MEKILIGHLVSFFDFYDGPCYMVTWLAYSSVFQEYAKRGAYAYVSMIQREERKNKVHGRSWVLRDGQTLQKYRGTFSKSRWHYKKSESDGIFHGFPKNMVRPDVR